MSNLLSILIPTYNRVYKLKKNLEDLIIYINNLSINKEIEIVISNNFSSDDTDIIVQECIDKNKNIYMKLYNQEKNIGLEKNAVYCLEKANGKYVMYIGDDDYISEEYLSKVISYIKDNKNISCIIPSFCEIDMNFNKIYNENGNLKGRDLNTPTKLYSNKFSDIIKILDKGHQLSGLVFLKKDTLEAYESNKVSNIYLFIYFLGFNSLRGNTVHLTDYPVKVTQGNTKDWNYGDDGLIDQMLKNTKYLFKNNYIKRFIAEIFILRHQSWRYTMSVKRNIYRFYRKVIKSSNITILTKITLLGIFIPVKSIKLIFRKIFFRFKSKSRSKSGS